MKELLLILVSYSLMCIFIFYLFTKNTNTSLWKWVDGRQQGCTYKKFTLWYFKIFNFGFDCYILKYEKYADLPIHRDEILNGEHYRVNVTLKGFSRFCILNRESKNGNEDFTRWSISTNKIHVFRPDIYHHCLQVGPNGCTKLSLGFVKFKK